MGSTEEASHGSTQPPVPWFPQSGTSGSASKKPTEAQERQRAQSTQNGACPPQTGQAPLRQGKQVLPQAWSQKQTSHGRGRALQDRTGPRRRGPGSHPQSWAPRDTPAGNLQGPHLSVPGEAVQEAACVQSSSSACSWGCWGCQQWVPPGLRAWTGQERLPGPHCPLRPPSPASPWACATSPRPPPSLQEAQCGFRALERSREFANQKQVV